MRSTDEPAQGPADEHGSHPLLHDERVTAAGLLVETCAGFREAVEADLEARAVTGSAFEVMLRLARSPGHRLRMSELAAQSTLTNSGLTRLVGKRKVRPYIADVF